MYHWFCKYRHVNFFSNVKCVRPTYGNKEARAPSIKIFITQVWKQKEEKSISPVHTVLCSRLLSHWWI